MAVIYRSLIVTAVCCGLVLLGYWQFDSFQRRRELAALRALNEEMARQLTLKEAMIDRLSRTRRLAHVRITGQRLDAAGEVAETDLELIELDDAETELGRQRFTIPGDVLFVDTWTVRFDHEDVAHGHPLYGRTLVLLRRVYSDRIAPIDGEPIDTPGAVPPGYAASDAGHFEQRVWSHFWNIATDAELAQTMGVRVAQGEAVYKPVRSGQLYELTAETSGGITLVPLTVEASEPPAVEGSGG